MAPSQVDRADVVMLWTPQLHPHLHRTQRRSIELVLQQQRWREESFGKLSKDLVLAILGGVEVCM